MTVKFTQSEINIREKIAELDRPIGVAGSELLRADTVEQQQSMLGLGRKNIIINGNFDIWQRGDTVSGAGYYFGADRWQGYGYGTNTSTTTKEQFDYGEFPSEVPAEYYMRITSTQSHPYFRQTIENPRRYSGKKLTYSLWARSDTNVSLNPGLVIFHSGGYIYASELNRSTKRMDLWWDLTSEWKKYTVTFQMPDLSAYTFNSNNFFAIEHASTTGITGAIDIAQVQLELGEVATPFEYRPYSEEILLCMRYFQLINSGRIGGVINASGQGIVAHQLHKIPMRTNASITTVGTIGFYYMDGTTQINTSISSLASSGNNRINISKANGSGGAGLSFWCDFTTSNYLKLDAEF